MNTVLEPLLLPGQVHLSETDRRTAVAKLDRAVRKGTLTPPQAGDRQDLLLEARTRGDLHQVLDGMADALPPRGLTVALQAVSAVWLFTCVVQFVIWVVLAAFGHFDWPWWLWSDIGLGLVVAVMWWTNESYYRKTDVLVTR